jgi:hypothetical protein
VQVVTCAECKLHKCEVLLACDNTIYFTKHDLFSGSVPQTVCRDTLVCRQIFLLCREKYVNASNLPNFKF